MPDERKRDRYAIRPDKSGFTVFVIWTSEPAIVGGAPQVGLSEEDARHTLGLLNEQSHRGDSSMRRNP